MKFKYLDKVRVLNGFYAGVKGTTVASEDMIRTIDGKEEAYKYLVELKGSNRTIEVCASNLEKVKQDEF